MRISGRNSGQGADGVVVEELGRRVGAVGALVEHLAGDVRPEAVGEVAAGVEGHAEHPLVAERAAQRDQSSSLRSLTCFRRPSQGRRLDAVGEHRPEGDEVGVDARVRLHVGVRGAEERFGMVGGQRFDGVDVLAAGVEAVADRALGVLVAEPGAHGEQHRRRGVVLAGDELQRGALVGELVADGVGDPGLDGADHVEGRRYAVLAARASKEGAAKDVACVMAGSCVASSECVSGRPAGFLGAAPRWSVPPLCASHGPPEMLPGAGVTVSRGTVATSPSPQRVIVVASCADRPSSTALTPSAPPVARPQMAGRPTNTARAPSASAVRTSEPDRIPPSA